MKALLKSIPRPVIIAGSLFVLLVLIALVFWTPVRVLNLQARAGGKIEGYRRDYAGPYENFLTCQIPALADLPPDQNLEQAVSLLEKAVRITPAKPSNPPVAGQGALLAGRFRQRRRCLQCFQPGASG